MKIIEANGETKDRSLSIQRAQSIKIKNLVNKRGTDLTLSNIKSNTGLSDDIFLQRALIKE